MSVELINDCSREAVKVFFNFHLGWLAGLLASWLADGVSNFTQLERQEFETEKSATRMKMAQKGLLIFRSYFQVL